MGTSTPTSTCRPTSPKTSTATSMNIDIDMLCSKYEKVVELNENKLISLIDTGSKRTLIKSNVVNGLATVKTKENITLVGLNDARVVCDEFITISVKIDGKPFEVTAVIVPPYSIKTDMILGQDFLDNVSWKVSEKFIHFGEKIAENQEDIFNIDIESCQTELNLEVNPDVDCQYKNEVKSIISNCMSVVDKKLEPFHSSVKMKIALKDQNPIRSKPRRLSYFEKGVVDKIVEDLLEKQIIRPSTSEYSSPIVLVPKKNKEMRLCVDYQALNEKTVKENFPLPVIDDLINSLANKQWDLIRTNDIQIYMDDLLIATETIEQNIQTLRTVVDRAMQYNLQLRLDKCRFLMTSVDYLGYKVCNGTIEITDAKTKAIRNFPVPCSRKDVKSFIGLTSYFRKFVKGYSIIAKPLTDLLRAYSIIAKPLTDLLRAQNEFVFGEKELATFKTLKAALTNFPILRIYDPNLEIEVHTDASTKGYGAVLLQKFEDGFHPVYYFSGKTSETESKYHSFDLEMLAIIKALEKFRVYLLGKRFTLVTDCNSLKLSLKKKEKNSRIFRWSQKLEEFDYTVEHRGSDRMQHVDALSRCYNINVTTEDWLEIAQGKDEEIRIIKAQLSDQPNANGLYLLNGKVFKVVDNNSLLLVPRCMRKELVMKVHDDISHLGLDKTMDQLRQNYYFKNMRKYVKKCLDNCVKSAEVLKAMARLIKIFGAPRRIITDRGTAFTSDAFKQLCTENNIRLVHVAVQTPRANGQVERINKVVMPALLKESEDLEKWADVLAKVQLSLNATVHRSLGKSPAEVFFGYKIVPMGHTVLKDHLDRELGIDSYVKARGDLRECAKLKNKKTQDENERNYNKKRKPHKRLNEGDIVMIKRTSPENDVNPKMSAKFVGPYQITKVLDNDRYCVADLPEHQVSQKPFTAVLAPERIKLWKRFEVDDEVGSEEDLEDETDPETEVDRAEEPNNGEIPEADLQEVSDLDEQDVEEVIRIVVTDDPDIGTMSDQDGRL
ncbi:Reverse transcriptase (RNA-dependent DNA polymerase) [Popillia japonica]|uniref:RNA-directed DNA polymerase n=1 Tax=Popillia japonica TaxID=7064 RepID=A0AAW1MEM4_POPJA